MYNTDRIKSQISKKSENINKEHAMIQHKKFNKKWVKFIKQHGYAHCTEKQCMNIKTVFHWFIKQKEKYGTDTVNVNCKNLGHAMGLTHDRSAATIIQRLCDHGICKKEYAKNMKNKGHKHIILTLLVPLDKIQELHDTKILVKQRAKKKSQQSKIIEKNVEDESRTKNLSTINITKQHNVSEKNKSKNVMSGNHEEDFQELNNHDYEKCTPVLMLGHYNMIYGTMYSLDLVPWWRRKLETLAEQFDTMEAWDYHCVTLKKGVTYNSPKHFSRILRNDLVKISLKKFKKHQKTPDEKRAEEIRKSNEIIDKMCEVFEKVTGKQIPTNDKKLRAHLKAAFDQCFRSMEYWEKYVKHLTNKVIRNTKGFLLWLLSFGTLSTLCPEVTALINAEENSRMVESQRVQELETFKSELMSNSTYSEVERTVRSRFIDDHGVAAYNNWLHNSTFDVTHDSITITFADDFQRCWFVSHYEHKLYQYAPHNFNFEVKH